MFRFQRQKPKLTAREVNRWNRLADMVARGELSLQQNGQLPDPLNKPDQISGEWVWVYNNSDRDFLKYEVCSIGELMLPGIGITTPSTNGNGLDGAHFLYDMAVENPWRTVGVCLEPIGKKAVGRVQISGVTKAWVVNFRNWQSYRYKRCHLNPQINRFEADDFGNCELIARNLFGTVTSDWRLVRLNILDASPIECAWTGRGSDGSTTLQQTVTGSAVQWSQVARNFHAIRKQNNPSVTGPDRELLFPRPGRYRISIQANVTNNATSGNRNADFYELFIGFRFTGGTGLSQVFPARCVNGTLPSFNTPNTHQLVEFITAPENGRGQLEVYGRYWQSGSGSPLSLQASGRVWLEMVEPRQPTVEAGHPDDFNKWTYTSGLETIDGGAGPVS